MCRRRRPSGLYRCRCAEGL
ncbi:MAG: hypothetical protein J6X71_07850 [Bacteroidales bacterium]|nr:hypothetical protein [Bacteroidales bacterium]